MATLHQGEDVARTVAAVVLVPGRPVLHRRVSRGLRDDPLLRSALDPWQWRRDAGWRGLGRAAARTYRLDRAALQTRHADRAIFRLQLLAHDYPSTRSRRYWRVGSTGRPQHRNLATCRRPTRRQLPDIL